MLQPRNRAGVTLIETIMVIVVLATAAAGSLMLMDGEWVARRNVKATINAAAESLTMARNTAMTSQTTVHVRLVQAAVATQLIVTQDPGPYRAEQKWTIDLGTDTRVSGSPTDIQFTSTGSANRGLAWTVTQSRSSGEITVAPTSGQVFRRLP
jgi:prepilin-type N-terminal cleavage/methylation domain-containing protein